ncbi:MAG: sulfatase-like hydrolase/transferase [Xanthobacteraceae bacterium]
MPQNLIIIMSDEHNSGFLGFRGHPIVHTPHMDRLAADGVSFISAYTPSPVCVPARAAFATGKYVHDIRFWDNAMPFDGSVPSWHSLLRERGHRVVSIGKLHFRSSDDDNGFSEEQVGMHVVDGQGDLLGLIRDEDMPKRKGAYKMARMAGPGESMYTTYDRDITARAQVWLREEARRYTDKPWILFVSLVCPHFPLTAPPEHFYRYYDQDLPLPKLYDERKKRQHPYIEDYRRSFAYDDFFETPEMVKRAQAGYLGLCSFLDENIGKILQAARDGGWIENTRVVYTSDHGDNVGSRGLWGKSTMYEESVGVPLIVAGPGFSGGREVTTPTSLLDIYPFIFSTVGAVDDETVTSAHPGTDLDRLSCGQQADRAVFSEYHGMGSKSAAYMIRKNRYKLVYYTDYPAQLFDLRADPEELVDIAGLSSSKGVMRDLMAELLKVCDPQATDIEAKATQGELLVRVGGKARVIARGDLGFSVPPGIRPNFD